MSESALKRVEDARPGRIVHEYDLPKSLCIDGVPTKIGMQMLTSGEELQASKVGGFDVTKQQYEATKRSIATLNGKSVSIADADIDIFWERCGPKVRSLLLQTYNRLSSPTRDETDSFFKSETTTVR